jgi:endoglucanase
VNLPHEDGIAVNQLGYRNKGTKIAIMKGTGGRFRLIDEASGTVVWSGETGPAVEDGASKLTVSRGDFSAWEHPGTYRIEAEDGSASYPFVISDAVYEEAHLALLKAFYYFRCGMELEEKYAGPWKHAACHLAPAVIHGEPSRLIEACGGWHDAGDYGKYVAPGAKAVADLLLAWEHYPQAFAKPVPLPETGGLLPDVLHECRYELEWLLRMQDSGTGGLYHKLTTLQFPPLDTMPEEDTAELYVSPVSAAATGCFAGVMAMAARVYGAYDEAFAESCLRAADQAWEWLERHPNAPGFRNPPEVATGEYGDEQDADERYWAAAELFRTTGNDRYHRAFRRLAEGDAFDKNALGWADMGGYGTIAYLMSKQGQDPELAARLKAGLLQQAEALAGVSGRDGFGISLRPRQYIWGSNMLVMNHAMLLLLADRLCGSAVYERFTAEHVHYLFGANPVGISYVTGFGTRSVLHPHHRPSEGDGIEAPVPGLVSGGPNKNLQDEIAREQLTGCAPAASFIDHAESYSTNEVTIYWNSPAVYVLSHFTSANR